MNDSLLNLRLGIDENLQSAENQAGTISYAVDTSKLYIDSYNGIGKDAEIIRQPINAQFAEGIQYIDENNEEKILDETNLMKKNDPEGSGSFSLNGLKDKEMGENSFIAGFGGEAKGNNSYALGYISKANGESSLAFGTKLHLLSIITNGKLKKIEDTITISVGPEIVPDDTPAPPQDSVSVTEASIIINEENDGTINASESVIDNHNESVTEASKTILQIEDVEEDENKESIIISFKRVLKKIVKYEIIEPSSANLVVNNILKITLDNISKYYLINKIEENNGKKYLFLNEEIPIEDKVEINFDGYQINEANQTIATAEGSFAFGDNVKANGTNSLIFGKNINNNKNGSLMVGEGLLDLNKTNGIVLGKYNAVGNENKDVFVVGYGGKDNNGNIIRRNILQLSYDEEKNESILTNDGIDLTTMKLIAQTEVTAPLGSFSQLCSSSNESTEITVEGDLKVTGNLTVNGKNLSEEDSNTGGIIISSEEPAKDPSKLWVDTSVGNGVIRIFNQTHNAWVPVSAAYT